MLVINNKYCVYRGAIAGRLVRERFLRAVSFFLVCKNPEDGRPAACHRHRFGAGSAKPLFDVFEFRVTGKDNFLKIVVVNRDLTFRPPSPNLLLETIYFIL